MAKELRKNATYYLAFPAGVQKVTIVQRGIGKRELKRRLKNPYVVRDCEGDEFVVPYDDLYDSRHEAEWERAERLGLEETVEGEESEGDDEDDDDEDEGDEEDDEDE